MIVIAGYGFVGRAVHAGIKDKVEVELVDPVLGDSVTQDHDPEAVIISVSTPQGPDGSCKMDNVMDVLSTTPPGIPVLIKSTISLEGWTEIVKTYPRHIITFSPEFLRAKTATEDFLSQKTVLLGGGDVEYWIKFWADTMGTEAEVYGVKDLILAKYFRNSFLATKVAYFNQIYDLCQKAGADFESVRQCVALDDRIGAGHTKIDPERGFGGHCFPKDTQALLETAKILDSSLTIIDSAVKYNKRIRREQKIKTTSRS